MIVPFLRSSSINCFSLCAGRFFIDYNIGRRGEAGKAALIGSICHGVMEVSALYKLTNQENSEQVNFWHDSFGRWGGEFCPKISLDVVYKYYNEESPGLLVEDSYQECEKLIEQALTFQDGSFNPQNCHIISAEYPFNVKLEEEWAKYSYDSPEGLIEDYVSLRGTVDLLTKIDDNTICATDYKTGRQISDWATGKEKTEESLYNDTQLQLYYYALAKCFPDKDIMMTLYFIRLNKAFTILFERTDLPRIENFLRSKYEEMTATTKPTWLVDTKNRWKCKWCPHYTNIEEGTKQTVCNYFKNSIARKGYDKVMAEKADYSMLNMYGAEALPRIENDLRMYEKRIIHDIKFERKDDQYYVNDKLVSKEEYCRQMAFTMCTFVHIKED